MSRMTPKLAPKASIPVQRPIRRTNGGRYSSSTAGGPMTAKCAEVQGRELMQKWAAATDPMEKQAYLDQILKFFQDMDPKYRNAILGTLLGGGLGLAGGGGMGGLLGALAGGGAGYFSPQIGEQLSQWMGGGNNAAADPGAGAVPPGNNAAAGPATAGMGAAMNSPAAPPVGAPNPAATALQGGLAGQKAMQTGDMPQMPAGLQGAMAGAGLTPDRPTPAFKPEPHMAMGAGNGPSPLDYMRRSTMNADINKLQQPLPSFPQHRQGSPPPGAGPGLGASPQQSILGVDNGDGLKFPMSTPGPNGPQPQTMPAGIPGLPKIGAAELTSAALAISYTLHELEELPAITPVRKQADFDLDATLAKYSR